MENIETVQQALQLARIELSKLSPVRDVEYYHAAKRKVKSLELKLQSMEMPATC